MAPATRIVSVRSVATKVPGVDTYTIVEKVRRSAAPTGSWPRTGGIGRSTGTKLLQRFFPCRVTRTQWNSASSLRREVSRCVNRLRR
jgi:hypothetical protein